MSSKRKKEKDCHSAQTHSDQIRHTHSDHIACRQTHSDHAAPGPLPDRDSDSFTTNKNVPSSPNRQLHSKMFHIIIINNIITTITIIISTNIIITNIITTITITISTNIIITNIITTITNIITTITIIISSAPSITIIITMTITIIITIITIKNHILTVACRRARRPHAWRRSLNRSPKPLAFIHQKLGPYSQIQQKLGPYSQQQQHSQIHQKLGPYSQQCQDLDLRSLLPTHQKLGPYSQQQCQDLRSLLSLPTNRSRRRHLMIHHSHVEPSRGHSRTHRQTHRQRGSPQ